MIKRTEPITFITGNMKKLEQVNEYITFPLEHEKLDLQEIQSLDLSEIATHKAKEAYNKIQKTVLVEDVALTFEAMGQLPGPLVKWFVTELGLEKLCRILDFSDNRAATAEIMYALYDGKEVNLFSGTTKGRIANTPKGDESFGWNAIFIAEGESRTWGELNNEEKKKDSMRKKALEKLEKYLSENE